MAVLIHFLHVIAVILWAGGMLFIGFVATPVFRRNLDDRERIRLILATGRRFRPLAWTAIVILWGTGLYKLFKLIGLSPSETFFQVGYGRLLMYKITLVLVATVLSAIHDFLLGPRYERFLDDISSSSASFQRLRRLTILLAITNEIIVLIIVWIAVVLRSYGLPIH